MSSKFNRREIIKASLGTAMVAMLPFDSKSAIENNLKSFNVAEGGHVSLVKHGEPKGDNQFLWSIMSVSQSDIFLENLNSITSRFNYKSEIKYKSNDKYKIDVCKEIINYLLKDNGNVSFEMILYKGNSNEFSGINPFGYNEKIDNLYTEILPKDKADFIITKSEDRYGPSENYLQKFSDKFGKQMSSVNAKKDIILQVNDLISGICFSILTKDKMKSKVKLSLNAHLDELAGISKEKYNSLIVNGPIKIKQITI